jgi:ArsR family transcriptional regulator
MDTVFRALGDPIRLRILQTLACCGDGCASVCACDLEPTLGLAQPTVSHHMAVLVRAGLVRAEKRGRWVHYHLERSRCREVADFLAVLTQPKPAAAKAAVAA